MNLKKEIKYVNDMEAHFIVYCCKKPYSPLSYPHRTLVQWSHSQWN